MGGRAAGRAAQAGVGGGVRRCSEGVNVQMQGGAEVPLVSLYLVR